LRAYKRQKGRHLYNRVEGSVIFEVSIPPSAYNVGEHIIFGGRYENNSCALTGLLSPSTQKNIRDKKREEKEISLRRLKKLFEKKFLKNLQKLQSGELFLSHSKNPNRGTDLPKAPPSQNPIRRAYLYPRGSFEGSRGTFAKVPLARLPRASLATHKERTSQNAR